MTDNYKKPWEPVNQFSWMREREKLIAEERRKLESGQLEKNARGYRELELSVPVSEIILYAKFARNHKEYWAARSRINKWWQENTDYDGKAIAHFMGLFREWYRMKFEIPYHALAFAVADDFLQLILNDTNLDDLDSLEARQFFLKHPFVEEVH